MCLPVEEEKGSEDRVDLLWLRRKLLKTRFVVVFDLVTDVEAVKLVPKALHSPGPTSAVGGTTSAPEDTDAGPGSRPSTRHGGSTETELRLFRGERSTSDTLIQSDSELYVLTTDAVTYLSTNF